MKKKKNYVGPDAVGAGGGVENSSRTGDHPKIRPSRFIGGLNNAIVESADGSPPRRMDGKPLSDQDRLILAGQDPIPDQIRAFEKKSPLK